ncbi:hypothetical protein NDU88_004785 [Pleurodeles waltl]|uniref:Uncharacterized protein n=1 Tax=Pleurodeles waltl TaxID=8319 RepID=A0AAV7WTF0_PLEWA|nr:hypothetical protein NDU88_004785 [Pleurodeles waltl]
MDVSFLVGYVKRCDERKQGPAGGVRGHPTRNRPTVEIDRDKVIENIDTLTLKSESREDKEKLVESLNKAIDDRLNKVEEDRQKKAHKFNRH